MNRIAGLTTAGGDAYWCRNYQLLPPEDRAEFAQLDRDFAEVIQKSHGWIAGLNDMLIVANSELRFPGTHASERTTAFVKQRRKPSPAATLRYPNWPDGPWQSEMDQECWIDEATGLPCAIVRDASPNHGELWGFMAVPLGHILHGHGRGGSRLPESALGRWLGGTPNYPIYSTLFPDNLWWFWFQCGCFGDLIPGLHPAGYFSDEGNWYSRGKEPFDPAHFIYCDWEYVKSEIMSLAKRAVAVSPTYWISYHGGDQGPWLGS